MVEWRVKDMTTRVTELTDTTVKHADMQVKLSKTFSQKVGKQDLVIDTIKEEIEKKKPGYIFECEYTATGYTQQFKTKKGLRVHTVVVVSTMGSR